MDDQKIQTMTTASNVKSDSNKPPLIAPWDELQRCTLITYWKSWPIMKRRAAARRYTKRQMC